MWDLESEVAAWSAAVYADRCNDTASAAELSDHLYCEIERARGEGLTEQQAFAAAVAKLGRAPELAAEEAKNRSALAAACVLAKRLDRAPASREHRGLLIAHAILWAALVIAASLVSTKTAGRVTGEWMLFGVLIPGWLASERILRRAMRPRPMAGA